MTRHEDLAHANAREVRTGTRGVRLHATGFGAPRGEWFANAVLISAEVPREVANQPAPGQPSAPTSPRR